MKEVAMTDADSIGWRGVVYGTAVFGADGKQVGTVREIVGSDQEDIFHGVRVAIDGQHDVMMASDDVANLTRAAVTSTLSSADIRLLPAYDEQASYHLASVGRLSKHLGWKQDSKSDEEPG
jgi:hypothetical protein